VGHFRTRLPARNAGLEGSLCGADARQRYRLDLRQIELARGMIDVEADNVAIGVEVRDQPSTISRAAMPGSLFSAIWRLSVSG
jgi:hypothetical protein